MILKIKVLYVDDEPALLDIGKMLMEKHNICVDTAASVEVAMRLLEDGARYDVVISDYSMPLIDGIDFLKILNRRDLRIPFILFTGKGEENVAMEAVNNNAAFYVKKGGGAVPDFTDLAHKIRKAAEKKQLEEGLERSRKAMGLLGSLLDHDINNCFSALMMRLDMLKIAASSADKDSVDSVEKTEKAVDELRFLFESLRKCHEIGQNDPEWVDLKEVCKACSKSFTQFSYSDKLKSVKVYTEPAIIKIVGHSLLENSQRHGDHVKNVSISCNKLPDGRFSIVYEDDGIGIPAEEKNLIFNRGHGKHTGLGLFLTRKLLTVSQMEIKETGEPGKGVRFEITVPREYCRLA